MITAIDRKLQTCIEKLNYVQKKSLLEFINTIIPHHEEAIYTIEQYNKELEAADAEIESGKYSTNEEVFEMSNNMINARKQSSVE